MENVIIAQVGHGDNLPTTHCLRDWTEDTLSESLCFQKPHKCFGGVLVVHAKKQSLTIQSIQSVLNMHRWMEEPKVMPSLCVS